MTTDQVLAPLAGRALPGADAAPDWLQPLIRAVTTEPLPGWLATAPPVNPTPVDSAPLVDSASPVDPAPSAVLILLSDGVGAGPDLLMTVRADTLRSHAGQPAFPGGRADPGEDAVTTALREGQEETGLVPTAVTPILQVRELHLGRSGNRVVPVIGYWHEPGPVGVVDPAETSVVARIPLAELCDPSARGQVQLSNGMRGPAFAAAGLVIWGFTGVLLDAVLDLGGWSVPWRPGRRLHLPRTDADFLRVESDRIES